MKRNVSILILTMLLMASAAVAEPAQPPVKSAAQLLNAGRVDDAIRVLDSHLQAKPQDAEAYNLLARTYFALKRWDLAVAAGEKAVALDPDNSDYHMWLGRIYGEKANHSNFITAARLVGKIRAQFERAVQLDSQNVDARTDLAEFYVDAPGFLGGGTDKALREAHAIAPQDPAVAHWVKARIAQKQGQDGDAEAEFKAAVESSGGAAKYWLELAAFYGSRHRYPEMEAAVTSAVHSERKKPINYFDAGSLLVSTGRNLVGAAKFIGKYLSTDSTTAEGPAFQAYYLLGQIREKEGDKAAAAVEYRKALQLASGFRQAREALARVEQH